jgi:hypothetical protein
MKSIIRLALLCAVASLSTTLIAQQAPPAGASPQGGAPQGSQGAAPTSRIDDIDKAAKLTPEQRVKVEAILKKTDEAIAASRSKTNNTWGPEAQAMMNEIIANEKKATMEVLNDSQKPGYDAYITAWKAARDKDPH